MKNIFKLTILWLLMYSSVNGQTKNIGPKINTIDHEVRPIVTNDKLFFVREPARIGKKNNRQEIWMSERDTTGEWGQSVKLPNIVNCQKYNEIGRAHV